MASKLYPLRLDDKTRERWEAAAAADNVSLATFVKETVEDRIGSAPAAAPRSKRATAKVRKVVCSREEYHRSGEFCKTCGTVPA